MAYARAHINPEMLEWARRRVNYRPEELARRAGTSEKIYWEWVEGERKPTIRQIQKVAKALGRPVSHFYLEKAPDEPEPRFEMRRVFGSTPLGDTKELALEIQEFLRKRETVIELFGRLRDTPPELPSPYTLDDDPEAIGEVVRSSVLNVSIKQQISWGSKWEALAGWRAALEEAGVLCFQMSRISLSEARGFAIARRPLPIAAFNSKDAVRGRIFTLLHEFGHILLGESSLHSRSPLESDQSVEFWCNKLAASILIPESDLLQHQMVRDRGESAFWTSYEVQGLARRYNVSAAAMVRRLHNFNLVAYPTYVALKEEFDQHDRDSDRQSSGTPDFYTVKLARLGRLLPSLAFRSFYADAINTRDLSSIFGTGASNLGEFEQRVMGTSYAFPKR